MSHDSTHMNESWISNRHDSFIYALGLIHICAMTHCNASTSLFKAAPSLFCVPQLIHIYMCCAMAHDEPWRNTCIYEWVSNLYWAVTHSYIYIYVYIYIYINIHLHLTRLYVCHHTGQYIRKYAQSCALPLLCATTHAYIYIYIYICIYVYIYIYIYIYI